MIFSKIWYVTYEIFVSVFVILVGIIIFDVHVPVPHVDTRDCFDHRRDSLKMYCRCGQRKKKNIFRIGFIPDFVNWALGSHRYKLYKKFLAMVFESWHKEIWPTLITFTKDQHSIEIAFAKMEITLIPCFAFRNGRANARLSIAKQFFDLSVCLINATLKQ